MYMHRLWLASHKSVHSLPKLILICVRLYGISHEMMSVFLKLYITCITLYAEFIIII